MRKRVFNTGQNLPKAGIQDYLELREKRDLLVKKPILRQSRKDKTVLYGGHALNRLLGRGYQRETYDYDIYSNKPKHHAQQLERSIDHGTNSDLAFVEQTQYPYMGRMKPLYRVKLHFNDRVEADYNTMPSDITCVKRDHGVRYETLKRAKDKYEYMNKASGVDRTAFGELDRIRTYEIIKNRRNRML